MELDHDGRDTYNVGIVTTVTVDGVATPVDLDWEASFDGGATYVAGTPVTGGFTWLLAGEDAEDPDDLQAVATITDTMHPKMRAIDNPEIVIRRGPLIRYSR